MNAALHVGCAIYHGDGRVLECVETVRDLARHYRLREVVFDPWRFGQAAQELTRERVTCWSFRRRTCAWCRRAFACTPRSPNNGSRCPTIPNSPATPAHTIARHSRRGWRIDKSSPRDHMDAIVALAMALERAEQPAPEPVRLVGWF